MCQSLWEREMQSDCPCSVLSKDTQNDKSILNLAQPPMMDISIREIIFLVFQMEDDLSKASWTEY